MSLTITEVAIYFRGTCYSMPAPARHYDVIRQIHEATGARDIQGTQGFLTNTGQFVDRVTAKKIAQDACQTKSSIELFELYSEDLW